MPKFIEGFADKLRVPAGARDVQVFDAELPGFGIRKFAKSHASYFVKFNVGAQQRRKTLGRIVRQGHAAGGLRNPGQGPSRHRALQMWGEHVAALVAGRQSKVVPLKRA